MHFANIDPAQLVINIVVLLFSLSIHESAHAWTADYLGDFTGRFQGRVSLNPLVHIDLIGTVIFPLLGMLFGWPLFGWAKPVPVNPRNLRNPRRDHIFVAAAGPVVNLIAAIGFVLGLKFFIAYFPAEIMAQNSVVFPLFMVCRVGLYLNIILAVFNLIPIPPLDGSWILSGLLPPTFSRYIDMVRPYSFMVLILLLYSGMLGAILNPVLNLVQRLIV